MPALVDPPGERPDLRGVASVGRLDREPRMGGATGPDHRAEVGQGRPTDRSAAGQAGPRDRDHAGRPVRLGQPVGGVEDRARPVRSAVELGRLVGDLAARWRRGVGRPDRDPEGGHHQAERGEHGQQWAATVTGIHALPSWISERQPAVARRYPKPPDPPPETPRPAGRMGLRYHAPRVTGEWPSGKAPDSGSGDRRFESFLASQHHDLLGCRGKRPQHLVEEPSSPGPRGARTAVPENQAHSF